MNLIDVNKQFATEEQCIEYLEKMRWPDGVRCVTCGAKEISVITRHSQSKNKRTKIYQCLETTCKQQFTATSGTIFHDSHLSLHKWFMAIALFLNAKKSLSALQLQRDLGTTYRTAWYLSHRIRKAMADGNIMLGGIVEMDETYIGGKTIRKSNRGNRPPKDVVFGMIQRGGDLKLVHTGRGKAKSKDIKHLIRKHVSPDVERVMTDESIIYPIALDGYCASKHETIMHKYGNYVRGDVYTNTIESAFSLLKRGLIGSFHRVSIKHLHRYLAEFEYRFNNRENPFSFEETVKRLTENPNLEYKNLVSNN